MNASVGGPDVCEWTEHHGPDSVPIRLGTVGPLAVCPKITHRAFSVCSQLERNIVKELALRERIEMMNDIP
jgi:hypothetical protein